MAIALDNTSSTTGTNASSLTFSHTCSGSDRILVVATQVFDDTSQAERTVSGITYNSVALTKIARLDAGSVAAELWYLIAPATGANNVVVTLGAANNYSIAGASSYTGVDQSNPIDASGSASGFSTTASKAITTTTDNAWAVDSTVKYNTTEAMTIGAGQSSVHNLSVGSGFGIRGASSYEGPQTPTGSVTMSWTWTTTNRDWATIAASLAPSVATSSTNSGFFALMG